CARASGARAIGAPPRTPTTRAADQRNEAPLIANTRGMLVATRSNPPRAGPTNSAIEITVLIAMFAAVSSPGVRANEGSSAASAGRDTALVNTHHAAHAY